MAGEYVLSLVMKAQDQASGAIGGFAKQLAGINPVLGLVGGALIGAGVAVVGFGVASAKMAADYEQQMNMVQSLTGSTDAQMQQYKNSIRAVSDETGKSSMDLSKGLYQVISAGFQGADATKVLGLAARDSVIGLSDQTTTTTALVVALNSFKIGAKDADNVSAQMLKTVSLGRMSMDDYAQALSTGAAAAHGNGVSMAEMNATLATLTSNGVKTAGVAMTDLTQLTSVMNGKTDMLTKRLHAQGITFDESKFKTLDYSDKVKMLGDAMNKLSYGQKNAVLGSKNATQALQILHDNTKMYNADVSALSDKQKLAKDSAAQWAKTQSGFNQSMTRMKTQLDNVMISVGQKLLPVLGKLADKVAPIIQRFADWVEKSGVVDKILDGLTVGIGLLMKGFQQAWPYIQQAGKAVFDFGNDLAVRLIPIIKNTVAFFKTYWPAISTIVSGVFDAVRGTIQIAWSLISGIIKIGLDLLSGNWKQAWTDLLDMLKGVWAGIQLFVKGEVKLLLGYIQGILIAFGLMKTGVQQQADDMKRQAEMKTDQMKVNSLAHTQAMAIGNIKNLEKQRLGIIAQLQQTKDPAARHMLEMRLNSVDQAELQQKGVVEKTNQMRIQAMLHIKKLHDDEIEAHKSMWQKSLDAVNNFGPTFVKKVQDIGAAAWKWIQDTWHNIQTSFERAWNDNVSRPLNDLGKSITDFFTNFAAGAANIGAKIVNGIADGIRSAAGNATGAISDVMKAIGNFLPHSPAKEGELAHLNEYGPNLINGISKGIVATLPSIKAAIKQAATLMGQGMTGQANAMYQEINKAQNALINQKDNAKYQKYLEARQKAYEKYQQNKEKSYLKYEERLEKYDAKKHKAGSHAPTFKYGNFKYHGYQAPKPQALSLGLFANETTYSDPYMQLGGTPLQGAPVGGTTHHNTTIVIQAPHMDAKAIAKEVSKVQDRQYRMSGTHVTNTSGAKAR